MLSDVTYPLVAYTTVSSIYSVSSSSVYLMLYRDMSSIVRYIRLEIFLTKWALAKSITRLSMICISKTCGCHISVTLLISRHHECRFMTQVMLGDSFVSIDWKHDDKIQAHKSLGASMTLVGLLPPLCHEGHMLVDGGYSEWHRRSMKAYAELRSIVDNLPVSSSRRCAFSA